MQITIESRTEVPDRAELDPVLRAYFGPMSREFEKRLGVLPDIEVVIAEIWDEAGHYLPPHGRSLLARDGAGAIVGMASLRDIGGGKGELKRLYVDPATRGTGLGRRLVAELIDAGREIGLTAILADTFDGNTAVLSLFKGLGFRMTEPFPESATYRTFPELRDGTVYVRLDL